MNPDYCATSTPRTADRRAGAIIDALTPLGFTCEETPSDASVTVSVYGGGWLSRQLIAKVFIDDDPFYLPTISAKKANPTDLCAIASVVDLLGGRR